MNPKSRKNRASHRRPPTRGSTTGTTGGRGRWNGGSGVVRRLCFLEPVDASILSNHRRVAPFGLEGGEPGKTGRNLVIRSGGECEEVGATASLSLGAGDRLEIRTPGGGGFGRARD